MQFPEYKPKEFELAILDYWTKNNTLQQLKEKTKTGPKFYFLQGPPYTSGRVHLGTAWNMALKDIILRYKRAQGFNVWDRMGYDMHGLPTEQKVMAKLGLKNKHDIEQYGLKKFTDECEKFCIDMMHTMNKEFIRLGATLDFSDPYQPISKQFMEAEWWLIKKAYEKGRLYQGLRTMHWDAATQTAVAKHELEYKSISDTSIYIKFPHAKKKNTFFIIWTTTPWTIPLNLAIMVNPKLTYCEVEIQENNNLKSPANNKETWIIAKDLVHSVMNKARIDKFKIKKEYDGKELDNQPYHHPLEIKPHLPKDLQKNPRLFTILLSEEYVDASAGTGLVHCAPGCGPEDYEVGHLYHIPPFNCVNEAGAFENFGPFTGLKAKVDDKQFIKLIDDSNSLLAKEPYVHDYPHGERSHQPVIFRTTKQWFFKVEDLKEKMLKANQKIHWQPQAGKNAFTSWLENLRDNSITKQRYWGTAVPIWTSTNQKEEDHIIIGSVEELEKLSGTTVTNMHIPAIDEIIITKDGKTYKRVPDVLDVWIDAGTVSWNCLDYPHKKELFKELFPADFILEGKDQIRGWFNLLMVASFLALDKPAFKNVYMHGFLNDVSGVKMSKSLGNIISPDELIEKHSADVLRYYMSQTSAGEDINFSWDECKIKDRNVQVLWNIHKFLITLAKDNLINPLKIDQSIMHNIMDLEEQYITSKLHSTIKHVTSLLEQYKIDEIIAPLEELYLELSRTYIQMIRDKSSIGDEEDKLLCVYTIYYVLSEFLKMFQIVAPFVSEAIYLNLKSAFNIPEQSITHFSWPKPNEKFIKQDLEQHMSSAFNIIQAGLAAREKAKLGLRWPIKEVLICTKKPEVKNAANNLQSIIKSQLNTKNVTIIEKLPGIKYKVKPEYSKIGPKYGDLSPQIITRLTIDSPETILAHIENEKAHKFTIDNREIAITAEMISTERTIPEKYKESEVKNALVYINTERTPELEAEGFAREIMRNTQQLRKTSGLQKRDNINLVIKTSAAMKPQLDKFKDDIADKVGASKIEITSTVPIKKYSANQEFTVKTETFSIYFDKVA
jgi:isoleucyl-tRNA synthetase